MSYGSGLTNCSSNSLIPVTRFVPNGCVSSLISTKESGLLPVAVSAVVQVLVNGFVSIMDSAFRQFRSQHEKDCPSSCFSLVGFFFQNYLHEIRPSCHLLLTNTSSHLLYVTRLLKAKPFPGQLQKFDIRLTTGCCVTDLTKLFIFSW
jgi:hypothetical protein